MTDALAYFGLGFGAYALICAAVVAGAVVQGAIGFGLNLIVVPVVAWVHPASLPASMIVMAIPMTAGSALRERGAIHRMGVFWTTIGRLPGVALGAWIVTRLTAESLALAVGGFVLFAALLSIAAPKLEPSRESALLVGLVSGTMGTASSIGGPPLALLYQNESGPVLRSTLGATFLLGTALSLAALFVAGEVALWQIAFGLSLAPAVMLGLFLSRFFHEWLDAGWLRPCVLAFAIVCALAVIAQGIG